MTMIKLESSGVAYNFFVQMLEIWTSFISSSSAVSWFIKDFPFQIAQYARTLFEYLLAESCSLETAPRVRLLISTLRHSMRLGDVMGLHQSVFEWNYTLLRHRLDGTSQSGWERLDVYLQEIFQSQAFVPPSQYDLLIILTTLEKCPNPAAISVCLLIRLIAPESY